MLIAALASSPALGVPQAGQEGRVAPSAVGEVGRRQTPGQPELNIAPLVRIGNRIQNRIQSRLRTRIDRSHEQDLNPLVSLKKAEDQVKDAGPR
jgi:hypothetical protein